MTRKQGQGTGTITKRPDGRYWARAPRDARGKRESLDIWPTWEEARQRIDLEIARRKEEEAAARPAPPLPAAEGQMRVVRKRRRSRFGGHIERIQFDTSPALERQAQARLERHLAGWRRAKELRLYLRDVRKMLAEWDYEIEEGGPIDTWLEWCELQLSDDPIEELRTLVIQEMSARQTTEQP